MNKKKSFTIAFILTLTIFINIWLISFFNGSTEVFVSRVVDGDTFISNEGLSYRLSNINSPEKNEISYLESKNFLRKYENKTINIEILGEDRYGRVLVRAYDKGDYLNLQIVKNGLAKKFLVSENEKIIFDKAEKEAIENEEGLWNHSEFFGCLSSKIDKEKEVVFLANFCSQANMLGWTIADESRKKYNIERPYNTSLVIYSREGEDNQTSAFWGQNQNVWNNDYDTLYVFDEKNNIVHVNSYGYS